MDLQQAVEVSHIYKGTPYVTLFSPLSLDWGEKRVILWSGYMVAVPSVGDPVITDKILGAKVSGVSWYFVDKTGDIMVNVYLEEM